MIISTSNDNWFLLIRQWKNIIRVCIFIHQNWDSVNTNQIQIQIIYKSTGEIVLQLCFAN